MKKLAAAAVVLLLAGCGSVPKPVPMSKKTAVHKVAPVAQPTPNQAIKKRWYDGFRVRWFNK